MTPAEFRTLLAVLRRLSEELGETAVDTLFRFNESLGTDEVFALYRKLGGEGSNMTVPAGVATLVFRLPKDPEAPRSFMPWEREFLLGQRQAGSTHGAGTWSLPGGRVEPNESLVERARLEVLEETGLVVHPEPFLTFPFNNTDASGQPWVTLYFAAWVHYEAEPRVIEPDKMANWGWYTMNNLPEPLFGPARELFEQLKQRQMGPR